LESYWACEADCHHCPGRKLNEIWGKEQRVTDPDKVHRKLTNALKNQKPKSPLAIALAMQKTIWLGRKADPYQPLETKTKTTRRLIKILNELQWSYVVCSRYTELMKRDYDLYRDGVSTLLIEITPGGESDWEVFERQRTTPVEDRLLHASKWNKKGLSVGIRGEPFIPGYHTTKQFRRMLRRLKSHGLRSYNTYNLHLNEYNAARFVKIGLDLERIWEHNQDKLWAPIQKELCQIADEEGIILGCPDFVNVPCDWEAGTNTCCGVSVPNAFKFNTHWWRRRVQRGIDHKQILQATWEGIGTLADLETGKRIINGTSTSHFTMKDAGL